MQLLCEHVYNYYSGLVFIFRSARHVPYIEVPYSPPAQGAQLNWDWIIFRFGGL